MIRKFTCRKCASGSLHRERVGLCWHGQEKMKGIALAGLGPFRIFRGRLLRLACTRLIARRETRLNGMPAEKN